MHEQKIIRRYQLEMTGAFVLYALVLVFSLNMSKHLPDGIGRTLLMVSPMVPFLFVVWAIVRQIRRADEYCRLQSLEAIAIAAAITAGLTFTYGFLENAGFPRLSMFTVWPVMCGVWCVIVMIRRWTER